MQARCHHSARLCCLLCTSHKRIQLFQRCLTFCIIDDLGQTKVHVKNGVEQNRIYESQFHHLPNLALRIPTSRRDFQCQKLFSLFSLNNSNLLGSGVGGTCKVRPSRLNCSGNRGTIDGDLVYISTKFTAKASIKPFAIPSLGSKKVSKKRHTRL
jgi:hypothetical protein